MHFLVIIALLAAVGITLSDRPYSVKMECMEGKYDCNAIDLHNNLQVYAFFSSISVWHGHLTVAIFCEVENTSDSVGIINRKLFSLVSTGNTQFIRLPFKIAKGLKAKSLPDEYEAIPRTEQDYVFAFRSVERYTRKQIREILKNERYYFRRQGISNDTIFRIKADDKRVGQ